MTKRKKKIIVTLTKDDFSKFPNDKELGAHARTKFTEQLEKAEINKEDYGGHNWVYPTGHRNV